MRYFVALSLFMSLPALAEYRVYQYFVQPKDNYPTKPRTTIVTSTLNPVSYRSYHGGTSVQIDLVRSWHCPGFTGEGLPPCEGPNDKKLESGANDED